MKCPRCSNVDTKVIDSRITEDNTSIRRRRECEKCEHRFTTFERLEFMSFFVQKSDGRKELYDRKKLESAIYKALNKRPVEPKLIDSMLNKLENEWAGNKKNITSKRVGKDVLQKLRDIDDIGFLRFASVYHKFDTLDQFQEFLEQEKEW